MERRSGKEIIRSVFKWGLFIGSGFLYLFTVLSGYAGWINPETWAFPAMLALMFFPLYLITVAITIGWNIYNYVSPLAIIGDVVVVLLIYPFLLVFPLGSPKVKYANETTFTVMSYNSFYCNDTEIKNPVRSRTLDFILTTKADIVCLQEQYSVATAVSHGKATDTQIQQIKALYPYRYEPGSRELVILSRYPITPLAGDEGKMFFYYQAVRVDVKGTPVTVLNVHMPSFGLSDQERQVVNQMQKGAEGISESAEEMSNSIYGKLAKAFANRSQAAKVIRNFCDTVKGDLIVCGDFNDVPGSFAYRIVRGNDLKDVYTETYTGYTPTFHDYMMYFHIDQMFYRGDMRALDFMRGNLKSSDHYPIVATFAIPTSR